MKPCFRILTCHAMLLVLLVAGPLTAAQSEDPEVGEEGGAKANILITVRIGRTEGPKRIPVKSYSLIVADGSPGSRLLSGQRVAFPTASRQPAEETGAGEAKAFVYQNVGFVTEARASIVGKDSIRLVAEIEDSRIGESQDGKPPVVETRQLSVNVVLNHGEPIDLTRVEGVTDHAGYVEVEARILR